MTLFGVALLSVTLNAAGIFVWPAWSLYDTIKGDMFKHNNFSHG
jgi:hypothetical protein